MQTALVSPTRLPGAPAQSEPLSRVSKVYLDVSTQPRVSVLCGEASPGTACCGPLAPEAAALRRLTQQPIYPRPGAEHMATEC